MKYFWYKPPEWVGVVFLAIYVIFFMWACGPTLLEIMMDILANIRWDIKRIYRQYRPRKRTAADEDFDDYYTKMQQTPREPVAKVGDGPKELD